MGYQLSFIERQHDLSELPSAKIRASDRTGVHSWMSFYAAFSENFASYALDALGVKEGEVVFDPFLGSGTTLVAARKKGASFVGGDLDPFACLLARAKVAVSADCKVVKKYLSTSRVKSVGEFSKEASDIFDSDCLAYAASVFSRVRRVVGGGRSGVLRALCSDASGKFDSEIVAIVAICIAASRAAKLVRGSNPTWYRKSVPGEHGQELISGLRESTPEIAEQMLSDLQFLGVSDRGETRVYEVNVKEIGDSVEDESVDYVVTSPPYLTRIDYVVNHLPNLVILSGLMSVEVESLRRSMIGTSKIVSKGVVEARWGGLCASVLKEIEEHKSYASKRYYYWTYLQYFMSLFEAVKVLGEKLKVGGKGVIVVQSSSYKDVYVPLSDIVVEMMRGLGLNADIVKRDIVKVNMKSLQASRGKVEVKPNGNMSSEDVVYFERTQ
ncbi:DNA methyltransferase [Pseudomonas pseudonitroreducens]|uniref:DNA methyltransferase n=1 Tax=Pseudomonas pseudonitroreducens TaxID=2892326 RepID=UPI001F3AC7CC|nr:DNA methyltransferase [Pseudomonas pseudonitroreducens]